MTGIFVGCVVVYWECLTPNEIELNEWQCIGRFPRFWSDQEEVLADHAWLMEPGRPPPPAARDGATSRWNGRWRSPRGRCQWCRQLYAGPSRRPVRLGEHRPTFSGWKSGVGRGDSDGALAWFVPLIDDATEDGGKGMDRTRKLKEWIP